MFLNLGGRRHETVPIIFAVSGCLNQQGKIPPRAVCAAKCLGVPRPPEALAGAGNLFSAGRQSHPTTSNAWQRIWRFILPGSAGNRSLIP